MQTKVKGTEGLSLLEGSGSLHTDNAVRVNQVHSVYGSSSTDTPRRVQEYNKLCEINGPNSEGPPASRTPRPGGKWDRSGDGGSAGLAIGLREMKRRDAILKITLLAVSRWPTGGDGIQFTLFQEF
jgi:hypothetical protein